ncbi:ubiquitin carboxyl-terminal hydrolase 9-like [Carex rostrata]
MTIPNSEGFLSAASCLPCTPEEEKEIVVGLIKEADSNMKDGDLYYLISHSWWMNWKSYVGFGISAAITENGTHNDPRPGEIDNSKLVSEGTSNGLELQRNLQEDFDYTLVPHEVWIRLHEWYKGGPEIARRVISDGESRKFKVVEVYPLSLRVTDEQGSLGTTVQISRKATVGELYRTVCSVLGVDQEKVELYDNYLSCGNKLENLDVTLEHAGLQMDQEIRLAQKKLELSPWPSSSSGMDSTGNSMAVIALEPPTSPLSIAGGPSLSNGFSAGGFGSKYLQPTSFSSPNREHDLEDAYSCGLGSSNGGGKTDGRGLMGLHNLGNTCFMNSALQCLVHTPQLVDYFLKDYTEEINKDNPLGMQGELAVAFGELLRKLWSAGHAPVAPRNFKGKLARFAPQFSGYNQHDSQELLAFLLDGLHEDLNRVKKKPYIEIGDSDGRPDELFAEECWRNHKARNDSIIVDVCQGQYKSTLVCPLCSKVSVTFDPFMYLSLPLPSTVTCSITVTIFSGSGDALPMPFTVTVPKAGYIKDISIALAAACGLKNSESLLLAEVYDHKIFRYIENSFESLLGIKDEDLIVAYRLPAGHEKLLRLEIVHQRADRLESEQYNHFSRKLMGSPLVTCISPDQTSLADVHAAVDAVLKPFVRTKVYPTNGNCSDQKNPSDSGPSLDSIVLNDWERGASTSDSMEVDQDQVVVDINLEEEVIEPSDQEEEEEKGEVSELKYPFILSLTDDKGVGRKPLNPDENEKNLFDRSSGCVRLMMDWTEREMDKYDVSYMEKLPEAFKTGYMSKKTRQEAVTLFSCLDAFLKEEPLGPDDMWYCPKCKEHRQATKKLDLWRLPEILVVHLKRFSYSRYMKNKLDTFVNFPIRNLDLSKYVNPAVADPTQLYTYELYAVINHYGGLGGGHYSAYAKMVEDDIWYHFDDSHVSIVSSEEDIRTSAAYVLFYRRVPSGNSETTYSSDSSSPSTWIPIS